MTITVTQLNNYIRGVLDLDTVLSDLSVCGEITNVKKARDGWYFSLKDEGGAINCFCYDSQVQPVAGNVAVAEGQLRYWVKSGTLSLFVRRLTATSNTGAAYLQFVLLRDKLQKEGLFDEERKQPVPHCCAKIGVVTSETGAVIHDIVNVALRRQPFTQIYLYPVKVQGAGAESEIADGINYFGTSNVDVVIVGRGGGSNEDLSVFNSETVVRSIAACGKPVVSAVGHGIDFTLCDFVADKRAVTPSEAAEFVTLDVVRERTRIKHDLEQIYEHIGAASRSHSENIVSDIKILRYLTERRIDGGFGRRRSSLRSVDGNAAGKLDKAQLNLTNRLTKLDALNPAAVLKRGFGWLYNGNTVIDSVSKVKVGDELRARVSDGTITTTVVGKEENNIES